MRCWLCRDVRKRTSLFARRANSSDATRATAVLPIPVGAWASRCRPSSIAPRASARKSAWPSRTRSNGQGMRTALGRRAGDGASVSNSDLHKVGRPRLARYEGLPEGEGRKYSGRSYGVIVVKERLSRFRGVPRCAPPVFRLRVQVRETGLSPLQYNPATGPGGLRVVREV